MNSLTQVGLLDNCIDGDKERLDALLGNMYDQFYCLYYILTRGVEQNCQDISPVAFSKDGNVALFDCPPDLSISSETEELVDMSCKISIRDSKKKTTIRIEKKQRRGGD